MAEHLQKDAKTYNEEYTSFIRELRHFHDTRGTSFSKLPRLNGREVDLYLLYSLVTSRGGWEKVNVNGDWELLLPYFGIHRLCANGSIGLKQIYVRYLDVYERVNYLGEEVDRRESELHEEDDARNRRKALRLLHATPTAYNAAQHQIPAGDAPPIAPSVPYYQAIIPLCVLIALWPINNSAPDALPSSNNLRNTAGFSNDTVHVTPTERLYLSLLCPLPNEQDFAINVCSLLAMENRQPFQLQKYPKIVDALLAHAGVFSQVDFRDLYTESYRKLRGQNLGRFWRDTIPDSDILQLSEEDLIVREQGNEDVSVCSFWSGRQSRSSEIGAKNSLAPRSPESNRKGILGSGTNQVTRQPTFVRPASDKQADSPRTSEHHRTHLVEDPSSCDDTLPSRLQVATEDESQCSVQVYENGTDLFSGPGSDLIPTASPLNEESQSASSFEPNFRNCLRKTISGSEKSADCDQISKIFPSFVSHQKLTDAASEADESMGSISDLHFTGRSQAQQLCSMNGQESVALEQIRETNDERLADQHTIPKASDLSLDDGTDVPAEQTTSETLVDDLESTAQAEPSVEKRIPAPKYKLPTAVLKPDNTRAVQYWLSQRRTAVSARPKLAPHPRPELSQKPSFDLDDLSLFHLGRDLGVHDTLGQRILQVLNIVRNLSFDEVNSTVLAQNEACVRLLLLAAHAKWGCLPQLAYDALTNLASEVKLEDPADCPVSAVLLGTVTRGLESTDRFVLLRSMETLGRLAQNAENESLLLGSLDPHIYERLCSYLTIPDVALLIYTLECVYALSSLGQTTCNSFLRCPGAIDILISLLTIEAQSYGSKARILMNVVETVSEGEVPTHSHLNPTAHNMVRPAHANSPVPHAPSTPPPVALQPVAAMSNPSATPAVHLNKYQQSTLTPTKTNPAMLSHAEKEQIAMQWLRSNFEFVVGAPSTEQNGLYKQYLTACSKNSSRQILGTVQFYSCVRATFGQSVGPFRKQVGTNVEFYFEGISPRNSTVAQAASPGISNNGTTNPAVSSTYAPAAGVPPGSEVPGSPILKAQLCAPPKAARKENSKPSMAHPHLSQALGQSGAPPTDISGQSVASGSSAPPSSSLIKSLLANKVPESNHVNPTPTVAPGLSPTATALPGMNRSSSAPSCMNLHAMSNNSVASSSPVASSSNPNLQVAQRQQQQRLLQQQKQHEINGQTAKQIDKSSTPSSDLPKVNGICTEGESSSAQNAPSIEESDSKTACGKGMLADLLEREVKKEALPNGATIISKELRISDKGLELVAKESRGVQSVDMGVVGMESLGVDLGDGTTPKAAHLIAQVDDAGHVQIHLEEEPDSSLSICNGQSLLDQLEAEVSSSTDPVATKTAVKRPSEADDSEAPAPKKAVPNHIGPKVNDNILEKAIEMTLTEDAPKNVNGTPEANNPESNSGVNPSLESGIVCSSSQTQTNGISVTNQVAATNSTQPVILAPNAPRTFLILQPQTQSQSPRLLLSNPGQRLLFTIPRPGGGVQHVAMPANMVTISSSQLQSNGGVGTLTTSGVTNISTVAVVSTTNGPITTLAQSTPVSTLSGVTFSAVNLPTGSLGSTTATAMNSVISTPSMEGIVTFSGGAVAFPAPTRPAESTTRNPTENHVTITPVSAPIATTSPAIVTCVTPSLSSPANSTVVNPIAPCVPSQIVSSAPNPAVVPAVPSVPAVKNRNTNSPDSGSKTRPRPPVKGRLADSQSVSSPSPQPDPTLQFLCEWKDCMRAFKTPHEVYVHACQSHCPAHVEEVGCLWDRCDGLKRKRFSMMTHLMDRHCNDEIQKLLAMRRFQMNTQGKTDIPAPQAPTPHPGYAPHAALHAIKRHAVELMSQKEQEEKEGPVTKSIRLTSALILRNFAIHSSLGRRCLRRYESHLASVALSNVESSRTVAQILYELTHQCS